MKLFHPRAAGTNESTARIYAGYEVAYTIVDFAAAISFVVGSVMFFYQSWQTAGTWWFLVGSILFALKPTLRLARELHYLLNGHLEPVAERLGE